MKKTWLWLGLGLSLFLAVVISPFASSRPDGLERVAEDKGFLSRGEGEPLLNSFIPDYAVPGVSNERVATAAAGAVGTLLAFAIAFAVALLVRKKGDRETRLPR